MRIMKITDELSRRIAQFIENYAVEHASDPPKLRQLVHEEKVLPLYRSMADVITINASGDVSSFVWDDTLHGQIEFDPRIRNTALFQGSKKYPELASLIEKPGDAQVCPHCAGTGIDSYAEKLNTNAIVCYCGGLGWIP
jgi:hypothetical protein